MKDKSKLLLIIAIIAITAVIAYICYGALKGEKKPVATMDVSYVDNDGNTQTGTIKIELNPDVAPETVSNFIQLANNGFYNNLTYHRIISDFMIQGGDPEGTGIGGPGYSIKGEFTQNGFKNDLKHTRGVLSMARSMRPDSAGSQFFIMHQNAPHLDGDYAAFGKLIEGEDILDKIAGVDTDYSDRPRKPQVMKTVTVETFGEEYPEPEKL